MANGKKKAAKAASLTGDLLVRERGNSKAGFVLVGGREAPPRVNPMEVPATEPAAAANDVETHSPKAQLRSVDLDPAGGGTADPQVLVQALRGGQLEQAEQLFGAMTGLSARRTKKVLYGDSGRSLAMACRALGFDQLQFASTFILTRKLGLPEAEADPGLLSRASQVFEDTGQEAALEVLNGWRRHEDSV